MKKEKTCSSCGNVFPGDLKHFNHAARAKDGLTNNCKWCRQGLDVPEKLQSGNGKEIKAGSVSAKPKIEMRTCSTCGKELELTAENFHTHANSPTGFTAQCKRCRNDAKKKNRGTLDSCITLDFRDDLELLDKFRAWAKKNRRPAADQIMWEIEALMDKVA